MMMSIIQVMRIIGWIQSKLLGEYEIKQWNSDQWNLKKDTSKLWQYLHIGFLFCSAVLHLIAAIAIVPPIYNFLITKIRIMQITAHILSFSALLFGFATMMDCWIDLAKNRSLLMKILALLCLYSSYIFVYSSIVLTRQIRDTIYGMDYWIIAGRLLGLTRIARLIVMTKFDVINSLIFSKSLQVHYEALLGLIGMMEFITALTFRAYSDDYQYFYYGVGFTLFISSLRFGAAFLMFRYYRPKRQQFTDMEYLNDSQDSI